MLESDPTGIEIIVQLQKLLMLESDPMETKIKRKIKERLKFYFFACCIFYYIT